MEKKGKKKDVSDFATTKNKIGPRDKSDFAKGFVPKKKDVSDFAVNTRKKTNGKKTNVIKPAAPTSFAQAFSQARKKLGAGKTFTYKGKKYSTNRADDKKKTKTVTNVVKPKLRPTNLVKKKTNGTKASKMGINGAATTVKKKTNGKTGLGSKTMSTKTKKTFKGTNITPTATQRKRMRSRMMGST